MPIGSQKAGLMGAAGGGASNYFGDGSDGSVTTSGDVTYTVANKSGSYDGDMYVANYTSLTISTGDTITVDQPCRGLLVYVDGNCTINGTLSMSLRGAAADPTASGGSDSSAVESTGVRLGLFTDGGGDTFTNDGGAFAGCGTPAKTAVANQDDLVGNGTIFTVSRDGGAGDNGDTTPACMEVCVRSGSVGVAGTTGGATISTGGGGSGGTWVHHNWVVGTGGNGAMGGCFSGGSGGGSALRVVNSGTGGSATAYGGAGGAATKSATTSGVWAGGGGAGNPGGAGVSFGGNDPIPQDGVGGLLWLIVKGDLTIGASGVVTVAGKEGALADNNGGGNACAGGSSGGGAVFVLYAGTLSNSGSVTAVGGAGETSHNTSSATTPGAGGAGGQHIFQIKG